MSKLPRNQIVPVLANMIDSTEDKKLASQIAAYLLETNRTGELESLARDLVVARANDGTVEVTVVAAHELSNEVKSDIERKACDIYPASRQIIINQKLDSSIVGGARLEFPDRQLDLSVRNKLNKFKQLTGAK